MWQEIAIVLIGLATIGYVGIRIYRWTTTPKQPEDLCSGCNGCRLKEEIKKNCKQ